MAEMVTGPALREVFPGALFRPFKGVWPRVAADCFVAPGAVLVGDIQVGAGSSIWYGVVMRGDDHWIRIGTRTNIQDGTVIHVTMTDHPTTIGDEVVVGHGARLHGCTVESRSLIGIGTVVLDGAHVEAEAMVAAGAVLTPRKRVPSRQLWAGSPAKFFRDLTQADVDFTVWDAGHYAGLAKVYREPV